MREIVSGADLRGATYARTGAGAAPRPFGLEQLLRAAVQLGLHAAQKLRETVLLDDASELLPVVPHEAGALGDDVLNSPTVAGAPNDVVDGDGLLPSVG